MEARRLRGANGSGLNPLIQDALMLNDTFTWLVRIAANEIELQWLRGRDMPGCLINCRWGKHRSVAAVEQITKELKRRWGPAVDPIVVHFERPRWDRGYAEVNWLWRDGPPWPLPAGLDDRCAAFKPWKREPVWQIRA